MSGAKRTARLGGLSLRRPAMVVWAWRVASLPLLCPEVIWGWRAALARDTYISHAWPRPTTSHADEAIAAATAERAQFR